MEALHGKVPLLIFVCVCACLFVFAINLKCYFASPFNLCLLVLAAADRCLEKFSKYKSSKNESKNKNIKRKAKEELLNLYGKKRKHAGDKSGWKHKFVCLAYHDQIRIPTSGCDKDELLQAGLGEREIGFQNVDIDGEEFRDIIYDNYPSLKDGGGFQFFKCTPNSRAMEKLSTTTLSSPAILKSHTGNARTYIRPIQRDLSLSPVCDLPGGVS